MQNLCIDIGNTVTKAALFINSDMVHFEILGNNDPNRILDIISDKKIDNCILSSVAENTENLRKILRNYIPNVFEFTTNTPIPVTNTYETPETLGKDRLAAVIGANFMHPGHNLLVIDSGTAITYDIIDDKGQYLGGNISPGMQMRYKALHTFTNRLPLISAASDFPMFGKNTTDAIRVGVQLGIIEEIDGVINKYKSIFPDLKVILTGGDAKYFDNKVKNLIFVVSNLVMIGLNRIIIYNV
jgi:type III pantothenate kinase